MERLRGAWLAAGVIHGRRVHLVKDFLRDTLLRRFPFRVESIVQPPLSIPQIATLGDEPALRVESYACVFFAQLGPHREGNLMVCLGPSLVCIPEPHRVDEYVNPVLRPVHGENSWMVRLYFYTWPAVDVYKCEPCWVEVLVGLTGTPSCVREPHNREIGELPTEVCITVILYVRARFPQPVRHIKQVDVLQHLWCIRARCFG